MRLPGNRWPHTKTAEAVLFFAQSFRAFLEEDNHEGFRAYALDTLGRLREARDLSNDIKLKRVNRAAVDPVVAELAWSIQNDEAAKIVAGDSLDVLQGIIKQKTFKIDELIFSTSLAIKILDNNYGNSIKAIIEDNVTENGSRIELLKATGFLVSHLMNQGHSREFLIGSVDKHFFVQDISRASKLMVSSFINNISKERRDYVVVTSVSSETSKILDMVGGWNLRAISDLPLHAQSEARSWSDFKPKNKLVVEKIAASDGFRASSILDQKLQSVQALLMLGRRPARIKWGPDSYVYTPRGSSGLSLTDAGSILDAQELVNVSGRRLRGLISTPKLINIHLNDQSKERIINAISSASTATTTTIDETRLISLWSAFEIMMNDPDEDGARIAYYSRHIPPMICFKYHRRLFSALFDQLSVIYRKKLNDLVEDSDSSSSRSQHTKFINVMLNPLYEYHRKKLMVIMESNPLSLHRTFRIFKQYESPKDSLKTIKSHYDRVDWQIHRIYRARNNIVHSGKSPIFLDSLVVNTFEYFQSAVFEILKKAKKSGEGDIDQIIAEIGFDWRMQLSFLESKSNLKSFDSETLTKLFAP